MQERKVNDDIAIITMSKEELAAFVSQAVRNALADRDVLDNICDYCTRRTASTAARRMPYVPANVEYKGKSATEVVDNPDLPQWARNGKWS